MDKSNKENFVEIPLASFNRKQCQFPTCIFETRFVPSSKNLVEFRKIIEGHGYQCISLISEERIIYACKSLSKSSISAVEVKELPHSQKNLYLLLNITSSLRPQLRPFFLMKNWRIENKIYLQDEKGNGVALVEYNLAESDLRSYIDRSRQLNEKLAVENIFSIFRQLVECLYTHHLHNRVLNDIRPETILLENGKWFIVRGELAEDISFEYGTVLCRPVSIRVSDKSYLSPLLFEAHTRMDQSLSHNSFKSDVYSLGLVVLELQTVGVWTAAQWRETLQNRKLLSAELNNFSLLFREKLIIKGKRLFCLGNLLEMMLAERETDRAYLMEVCLLMNFSNIIMSKILVPHEQFFRYEVVHSSGNRKKVIYPHVPIQYEGELKENPLVKEGKGNITYCGVKVFEGDWKDNLPDGKCSVYFSDSWKYEGFMKEGRLDGQGFLFFNGTRLNQGRWFNNLSEDRVEITNKQKFQFKEGYYLFLRIPAKDKEQNSQYKVYYKQFNSEKKLLVLNVFLIDAKQIVNNLVRFFSDLTVTEVSIHENVQRVLYNCGEFDLISLTARNGTAVEVVTALGQARPLLLKLFETEVFQVPLSVNLQNSKFNEDELRELLEKPVTVQVLNLSGCRIADKGLRILSISERAKFLRSLNLSHLEFTDKSLSQFTFSRAIQNLEALYLNFCKNLSSETIASFLCNEKLKKLRHVEIEATSFTHYGLEKVIKFNNFARLEAINIGLCHKINDAYFITFLKNKVCTNVKTLSINSTILTDNILEVMASPECRMESLQNVNLSGSINLSFYGLSRLFTSSKVASIQSMNLSGTYIDDEFLVLMARKSHLSSKNLRELQMASCFAITDKAIGQLLRSENFANLEVLDISRTFASNDTLYALADAPIHNFKSLNISKCQKMSDFGLEKFIMSENTKALSNLNLSFLGIQSGTFTALAESKYLTGLASLKLEECMKIDEPMLIKYFRSANFKSLEYLNLSCTLITNKTLQAFNANSYNFCRLIQLETKNCRNINGEGLRHVCLPNKFLPSITHREQTGRNTLKSLAQSQVLLKMNSLSLTRQGQTDLPVLFQSQFCCNLNTISIQDSCLNQCFQAMRLSKHLRNLKKLSLKGCQIDEPALKAFLKSDNARSLEELDISWTLLGNQTMFALAQSSALNFLQSLRLGKCININDKGMERFFGSKKCSTLKDLDLRATLLTNYTLESIANSKYLKSLKKLCLRSCPNMKDLGIEHLLKSPNCSSIRSIDFSWCKFTGELFRHLRNSSYTTEVRDIAVSGLKDIEHELLVYITSSSVASLRKLDISSSSLTESSILQIFDSEILESIEEIDLSNLELTRGAVLAILRSKNIEKIHRLGMANILTPVDLLKTLIEGSQRLTRMESVKVHSTKGLAFDEFKKYLPNLQVVESRDIKESSEHI